MIKSKVSIVLLSPQQGYLDVDPNTEVPFTFSVSDVKDLTKKNGVFSKTIKLSGTKNNNQLLNNYFDVNVVDGTFNINRLQKVQVLRGGVPVLKEGYLQLVNVQKVQNTSNSTEQLVEYNVLIKDTVADLFTKINPLELTDLEFGHLDHTYNAANVISSFSNDVNDEYKYVLPYSEVPAYKLNQLKPGIFAKVYWDKILDGAGFTYEWTAYSADTVQFDKLIIPYNGDELKVDQDYIDSIKVIASKSADTTYTSATTLTYDVETQDPTSAFDPATGIYTNQFYIDAANNLTFTYEVEYEVRLVNPSASAVTLYDLTTTSPQSFNAAKINYVPRLNLKKGNNSAGSALLSNTTTQFQRVEGATLSAGTTSLGSYTKTITLASNAALPTNTFKTEIDILTQQNSTFNQGSWRNGAGSTVATTTAVTVTAQVVVKNVNLTIQPNLQSIAFNSTMRMNTIVPKKVKQSQFIKDIITMYNLYVEVDENDSTHLIFKSRDEYYDSGIEVNWTKKLAKNMQQQVTFLPQVTKKRLVMTYKHDDADVMLKGYKDNVNEVYGQVEYTFDSEYVKDIETKELGFSPVAVGQPSWGPVLPFINGVAPKTNIKIAINGAQYTNANSFSIENYPGSSATTTTYPLISHFDAAQNPSFDLNWALNDYYYYGTFGAKTNNNLYNLYWRRTINQINKGKMLTAYFHLTEKDINRLRLNQKIFVNNAWWNINQIIDYKAGKDELTKVELLSVDDSIKFVPFKTKRPRKPAKGDHTIRPIKEFNVGPNKETNVFISDGPSVVTGKNNFLGDSVKNSTIIGDSNAVYSEKSMVLGDNNTLNSDAIVFGDDNYVNENIKNAIIFGNSITATTSDTLYAGNLQIQGTINGYTIDQLASGSTSGGTVTGDYLPLSGGTLTGDLVLDPSVSIKDSLLSQSILMDYDDNSVPAIKLENGSAYKIVVGENVRLVGDGAELQVTDTVDVTSGFYLSNAGGGYLSTRSNKILNINTDVSNSGDVVIGHSGNKLRFATNLNSGSTASILTLNSDGYVITASTSSIGTGNYLPLSGGSMTGAFTAQTISISGTSVIKSTVPGGQLDLGSYGAGFVNLTTDNGGYAESGLDMRSDYLGIFAGGYNTYLELYEPAGAKLFSNGSFEIAVPTIDASIASTILKRLKVNVLTGTSVSTLGIDSNGYLVSGATAGSSFQYWTSGSSGTNSVRLNNGSGVNATGDYSIAIGSGSTTSGNFSFVGGQSSISTGTSSMNYGYLNKSFGDYQFVFGLENTGATGASNAYVFGSGNIASNADTIAFGTSNNVSAASAKAFGANLVVSGTHGVAFGKDNIVSGIVSIASGEDNLVSGNYSFAANAGNQATGDYSAVFGNNSKAAATNTFVFGDSITGATANTTYVDKLNIKTVGSSSPIINLGLDSSGNVVTGTTGGSGSFTGGTVAGATTFQSDVTLNTIGSGATVVILGLDSTGKIVSGQTSTASVFDSLGVAITDETTAITTGTTKLSFRMPYQFQVTGVTAYLGTTGSTTTTVDVNRQGSTIFSAPIDLTSGQYTTTATNLSSTILYDSDIITVDIDAAGSGAKGLKLWINGYRTQIATVNNTGGLSQMQIEGLI